LDLHGSIIDQDHSAVVDTQVATALDEGAELKLKQTLDARIERRVDAFGIADREYPINQMRREIGKFSSARGVNELGRAGVGKIGSMSPVPKRANSQSGPIESVMPGAAQWISAGRTLRNHGERQSLCQR